MSKQVTYRPRLQENYDSVKSDLLKELAHKNIHQLPQLQKIVVSVGLGKGKDEKRLFEAATTTLRNITGQQPIQTKARKSIASFKLREGNPIGLKVTLRGARMYEFLDRLITVVLPRLRDFHGVSLKSFDKQGNFNIGLVEQSVFPELSFEETIVGHGVEISIVVENGSPEASRMLLTHFGMPFEKVKEQ